MKEKFYKYLSIFLFILLVCMWIGFPNTDNIYKSAYDSLHKAAPTPVILPWDLKSWPKATVKCTNSGNTDSEIIYTIYTSKNKAISGSFSVAAGDQNEIPIEMFDGFKTLKNAEYGKIVLEMTSADAECELKHLPYNGEASISGADVSYGKSFILATPYLYKKPVSARLVIYNFGDSALSLKVEGYSDVGTLKSVKTLQKINRGKKRIYKLKRGIKSHMTYHLIPQAEGSDYLAFYEITNERGKSYIIKTSTPVIESVLDADVDKLVIGNTSSVPAYFTYAISANGQKMYQGLEWVQAYSQRIIKLSPYTTGVNQGKIRIATDTFFYPQECFKSKKTGQKQCATSTRQDLLLFNAYPNGSKNIIYAKDSEAIHPAIVSYTWGDKSVPNIPLTCFKYNKKIKDNDNDGLCNHEENQYGSDKNNVDTDGDGLNDGAEIVFNNSSPAMKDTDDDGYDDQVEFEALTRAYDSYNFPNSPNPYSVEGLKDIVKMMDADSLSMVSMYAASMLGNPRGVEGIGFFCGDLCDRGFANFCSGENVCILGGTSDQQNQTKEYVERCLNEVRGAVGNILVSEYEMAKCQYCTTNFQGSGSEQTECSKSTLRIYLEGKLGRAYSYPSEAEIHIPVGNADVSYSVLCREILHNFGLADLYYGVGNHHFDNVPCSMMGRRGVCMSDYDKINLQIAAAMKRTGKSYDRIVAAGIQECSLTNGEKGYHVEFGKYFGKCLKLDNGSYPNCNYDEGNGGAEGCQEDIDSACGLCDEGFQAVINPDNPEEYICCRGVGNTYCAGQCCANGDACDKASGMCTLGTIFRIPMPETNG